MGQAERNILYRDHGRRLAGYLHHLLAHQFFFLLPLASAKPKQARSQDALDEGTCDWLGGAQKSTGRGSQELALSLIRANILAWWAAQPGLAVLLWPWRSSRRGLGPKLLGRVAAAGSQVNYSAYRTWHLRVPGV